MPAIVKGATPRRRRPGGRSCAVARYSRGRTPSAGGAGHLDWRLLADGLLIDYRRSSMDVERGQAETWASWFRALGDPSRILILNLLATAGRPMSVGEIVDELDLAQSTVSHHLKILGDVGFAFVDREATSSWWRVNERCLACFPSAAEVVMGRLPVGVAPWDETTTVRRRTP